MGEGSGWGDRLVRRSVMMAWLALGFLLLMGSLFWFNFYFRLVPSAEEPADRLGAYSGPGDNPEAPPPGTEEELGTEEEIRTAEAGQGGNGPDGNSTDQNRKAFQNGGEKSDKEPDEVSDIRPNLAENTKAESAGAENAGEKANHPGQEEESEPELTNVSPSSAAQSPRGDHSASAPHQTPAKQPPAAGSVQKQQEGPASGKPDAVPAVGTPSRKVWTVAQLPAIVKRVPADEPVVYLTFDDGPTRYLAQIVQVLIDKQAPAMFFWIGKYTPPSQELVRLMQQSHLQVGTHTVNHQRLSGQSYQVQKKEIEQGMTILSRWIGSKIHYVRPPYGARDHNTDRVAKELGLKTILWSIDPRDWEKGATPEKIIQRVTSQLHPGAVILLHEKPMTLQALPQLIERIRDEGYQLAALPAQ